MHAQQLVIIQWMDSCIPKEEEDLQYGDVYSYLIESPGNYFFIPFFFYKFYSVLLIITKTK